MDGLKRVIERVDIELFELITIYTHPLWNQMTAVNGCILVDNQLAVPLQLRQAVMMRNHRDHTGAYVGFLKSSLVDAHAHEHFEPCQ